MKTMGGEQLESTSVGPLGLSADRGWAIRDETTGEVTNGKYIPLLMQPKDASILRSIVKDANQNFGVYASVAKEGEVRIGDRVELL